MQLNSAFSRVAAQFRIEFDELTREIEHRGEAGAAREEALRKILRRYLPQRVEVGTGFVVDACEGESKQIDLVLYDRTAALVLPVSHTQYYACETVIAVGSVRTSIESRESLIEVLDNVASVKALDRSNRGRNANRPITGPGYSMSPPYVFDPVRDARDQIFGFVFTGHSLSETTLMETLRQWTASNPRAVWPNVYCDFNTCLVSYEAADGLTSSPMEATNFYVTAPEEREALLLLFTAILASFVNEAHVARPDLLSYARIGETIHTDYPLPDGC